MGKGIPLSIAISAVLFVFLFSNSVEALSCMECEPNDCPDVEPVCCFSGFTTLDLCGCCKTCTKKRGERCGRVWMLEGKCGPDDVCMQMLPRNGRTEAEIKMIMENDGNGTCHDKTTYDNVITNHQKDYVIKVKTGGTAANVTPIRDCSEFISSTQNYQPLKNKGGYADMTNAANCNDSNINSSYGLLLVIFISIISVII